MFNGFNLNLSSDVHQDHMEKWQKHKEPQHTREPRGQPFTSKWSQGCKDQTRQHLKAKHETNITKGVHKWSTSLA